jgi:hypothetical protein
MSTLQARNQTTLNAPISPIWAAITDINLLPRINPGVVKASGNMDTLYATRTCEIQNKGRKGTITEKLVEIIPQRKTVWKVEADTMGMSKMLRDTRFYFMLEKLTDSTTSLTAETHYTPVNFLARVMNGLMMKRMFAKAQHEILQNIGRIVENNSRL